MTKGSRNYNLAFCCRLIRPNVEARATSIPCNMYGASNKANGAESRSPEGYSGGRASAALPLLDDVTALPASWHLASGRPALAPKWICYSVTDPNLFPIT
jgi:hypothetical protein